MRVILADDSQLIIDRLQNMLGVFKGVEIVGSFNNGAKTLEAIRILNPDLVIIDINMQGFRVAGFRCGKKRKL